MNVALVLRLGAAAYHKKAVHHLLCMQHTVVLKILKEMQPVLQNIKTEKHNYKLKNVLQRVGLLFLLTLLTV